jgi:hypothetical protein
MSRVELRSKLSRITAVLLGDDPTCTAFEAVQEYIQLLSSVIDFDTQGGIHQPSYIYTPFGKALSPLEAARCIPDYIRTQKFIKGLYLAVKAALHRFPDRPVHLLYAGTGPYATLALPLTVLFSPEELQMTLLEIYPESFQALHTTIDAFGIRPFVRNTEMVDATTYCPAEPVHVLVTETMNQGLGKEPQVAITQHLASFLVPSGILVPASVKVVAGVMTPSIVTDLKLSEQANAAIKRSEDIALLMDLDQTAPVLFQNGFPATTVSITPALANQYNSLFLFTRIHVFGSEYITDGQSILTLPLLITHLPPAPENNIDIEFTYQTTEPPGFHWTSTIEKRSPGYQFNPRNKQNHLDEKGRLQMMEHLRAMGTVTALQIIADLEQ